MHLTLRDLILIRLLFIFDFYSRSNRSRPSLVSKVPAPSPSKTGLCQVSGCGRKVYIDRFNRSFKYCSPKCRDAYHAIFPPPVRMVWYGMVWYGMVWLCSCLPHNAKNSLRPCRHLTRQSHIKDRAKYHTIPSRHHTALASTLHSRPSRTCHVANHTLTRTCHEAMRIPW